MQSPANPALEALMKMRAQSAADDKFNRALAAYKAQCRDKVTRVLTDWKLRRLNSWQDIGIADIPAHITAQPLCFMLLQSFLTVWSTSAEARFRAEEAKRQEAAAGVSTKFVAAEQTGFTHCGRFTFKPRQRKAIDAIIDAFRSNKTSAVLLPLEGGQGKSVICWAVAAYWQKHGWFDHPVAKVPLNQAIFSTHASVKLDMAARGRACEITDMNRKVIVISHSELSSQRMRMFFVEEEIETYGQKTTKYRYILTPPAIIIIDECDAFKKPSSLKSKYMLALVEAGLAAGSKFIFASATPNVTVNNAWLFAIATGRKYMGEPISLTNWPSYARAIAARGRARPDDNSPRAMEEFRKEFHDCIIVPPRDPSKVKARNRTMLLEFESDEDRKFYADTELRYQEELERMGKGDMSINPMSLFTKFRAAEEWLKAKYFARLAADAIADGLAPAVGVSFHATLCEVKRLLVYKHNIPLDKISTIHGGIELITEDKLRKMVGPQLFTNIGDYVQRYFRKDESLTPAERTAVKKWILWTKERAKFGETRTQQVLRQDELLKLNLTKQSLEQRFIEKERYQNGDTYAMLFTLSSGGRGIDMDKQFAHVRNRVGFFTICYYAEEFLQAYWRLMRAMTLEDVDQYACFFKGTLPAQHVAPRLQAKLNSVRAGTVLNDDLADEAINLLSHKTSDLAPPPPTPDVVELDDTVDADGEVERIMAEIEDDDV